MFELLILDGGLGTSLEQKYHVEFSHATPLWSSHLLASDKDTLEACQRDFGQVPVDVILTATYQLSIEGALKTQTSRYPNGIPRESISGLVKDAVDIAAAAKSPDARIALSVGPYGACMIPSQEYSGVYDGEHDSKSSLLTWHQERMLVLAEGVAGDKSRIGFVALETIPRVDEIAAMRQALASTSELASIPFWMSCLFPGDENRLPDGSSVEQALEAMLDPQISTAIPWAVGINCTKTWKLDELLREYESVIGSLLDRGFIDKWPALILYPDGTNGEVYNTETQRWDLPSGSDNTERAPWEVQVADVVKATRARGQWSSIVVGGCCMASHEDIRRLRTIIGT